MSSLKSVSTCDPDFTCECIWPNSTPLSHPTQDPGCSRMVLRCMSPCLNFLHLRASEQRSKVLCPPCEPFLVVIGQGSVLPHSRYKCGFEGSKPPYGLVEFSHLPGLLPFVHHQRSSPIVCVGLSSDCTAARLHTTNQLELAARCHSSVSQFSVAVHFLAMKAMASHMPVTFARASRAHPLSPFDEPPRALGYPVLPRLVLAFL